jgi:hypothetical protein
MKLSREPAAWAAVVATLLSLIATLDVPLLTEQHTGAWVAVIDAGVAIFVAYRVRPWEPALISGFIAAGGHLVAAYSIDVSGKTLAALNVFVLALMFLLTRGQQTPKADPVATAPAVGVIK